MAIEKSMLCLIKDFIIEDRFSAGDKEEIRKLLDGKREKRSTERKCLASVIEEELKNNKENIEGEQFLLCWDVLNKCFWESETGNMNVYGMSNEKVISFMKEAVEEYKLSDKEALCFMGMLRMGLKKLYREGILKSVPKENIFR